MASPSLRDRSDAQAIEGILQDVAIKAISKQAKHRGCDARSSITVPRVTRFEGDEKSSRAAR
jgi:hypothetical protein